MLYYLLLTNILPFACLIGLLILIILGCSNFAWKKRVIKGLIVFTLLLIGICSSAFVIEWGYTEIKFQLWLREDSQRVDFSIYSSEQQVREALLTKLPIGSSEQKVRDFFIANEDGGREWKPDKIFKDKYGEILSVPVSVHGSLFTRESAIWFIDFYLDKMSHNLIDIQVYRYEPPMWP